MPIKGLTDRNEGGFACIGMIRKGAPKGANRPGEDLHHFRVEFGDKDIETAKEFLAIFSDKPTDIVVVLPFSEPERCWEAWREGYLAGALIHRCDGEFIQYAINPKTGEKLVANGISLATGQPIKCDGMPLTYYQSQKSGKSEPVYCRPVGRLRVMIPALKRIAYLVVHTTSIHDIINISEQLKGIAKLRDGNIAGIPLLLKRRPYQISTPGEGGKRVRREKWLISIEADPQWARAQFEAMQQAALPTGKVAEITGAVSGPSAGWKVLRSTPIDEGPEWPGELFDEGAVAGDAQISQHEPESTGDPQADPDAERAPETPEPAPGTLTESPASDRGEAQLVITQVLNQGGRLYIEDGHLKLNGKSITPTLREKVKLSAKAIVEVLENATPF